MWFPPSYGGGGDSEGEEASGGSVKVYYILRGSGVSLRYERLLILLGLLLEHLEPGGNWWELYFIY